MGSRKVIILKNTREGLTSEKTILPELNLSGEGKYPILTHSSNPAPLKRGKKC